MANNYNAYVAAADVAIRWEKATDMLDNGIVIHHITQDTQEAFTMKFILLGSKTFYCSLNSVISNNLVIRISKLSKARAVGILNNLLSCADLFLP